MKRLAGFAVAGVFLAAAGPVRAGEVKVSFANGLVTVVATDASPGQILGEWARRGQVRITNLDRVAGSPLTLQLTDVPEAQALETLLRGTAGYVAAPRGEVKVTSSHYDRILLLPGVAPVMPAITSQPAPSAAPGAGRGRPSRIQTFDAATGVEIDSARTPPRMMQPGMGRDIARPGSNRQSPAEHATMPGITFRSPAVGYRVAPTTQAPGTQTWSPTGAVAPGMPTAPAPATTTPSSTSSFPGQIVIQPGQIVNTPVAGMPSPGQPSKRVPATAPGPVKK